MSSSFSFRFIRFAWLVVCQSRAIHGLGIHMWIGVSRIYRIFYGVAPMSTTIFSIGKEIFRCGRLPLIRVIPRLFGLYISVSYAHCARLIHRHADKPCLCPIFFPYAINSDVRQGLCAIRSTTRFLTPSLISSVDDAHDFIICATPMWAAAHNCHSRSTQRKHEHEDIPA